MGHTRRILAQERGRESVDGHDRHALAWQAAPRQALAHLACRAIRERERQHLLRRDALLLDEMGHTPHECRRLARARAGHHEGGPRCAGGPSLPVIQPLYELFRRYRRRRLVSGVLSSRCACVRLWPRRRQDGVDEPTLGQETRDAEVCGETCDIHALARAEADAHRCAGRQQLRGEGVGLELASCSRGIFLDAMVLCPQVAGIGLLINLVLVAGGVQADPLAAVQRIVPQLMRDGEEARLRLQVVAQPDDPAKLRLVPRPELQTGVGAAQHDVAGWSSVQLEVERIAQALDPFDARDVAPGALHHVLCRQCGGRSGDQFDAFHRSALQGVSTQWESSSKKLSAQHSEYVGRRTAPWSPGLSASQRERLLSRATRVLADDLGPLSLALWRERAGLHGVEERLLLLRRRLVRVVECASVTWACCPQIASDGFWGHVHRICEPSDEGRRDGRHGNRPGLKFAQQVCRESDRVRQLLWRIADLFPLLAQSQERSDGDSGASLTYLREGFLCRWGKLGCRDLVRLGCVESYGMKVHGKLQQLLRVIRVLPDIVFNVRRAIQAEFDHVLSSDAVDLILLFSLVAPARPLRLIVIGHVRPPRRRRSARPTAYGQL